MPEAPQPNLEVDVPTQRMPREARAIQTLRMDVVQGAEDLSLAEKVTLAADAVVTLAEQLLTRDQDMPVLVISSHSDVEYRTRSLSGKAAFARKPFVAAELVTGAGALVG